MRKIRRIIVHCTATLPTATVSSILRFWRMEKHWKQPGYHYIIATDGTITQLADDSRIANGAKGFNAESLHVAYIGGIVRQSGKTVSGDTRTPAQRHSLEQLLTLLHKRYPRAFIMGHRDLSPDKNHNGVVDSWERIKDCPCFDAIPEYEHIRTMNNNQ